MAFNSPVFLFFFLPLTVLFYSLAPQRSKNLLLVAASVFFYMWSDADSIWVFTFSILANYVFGLALESARTEKSEKVLLGSALTFNVAFLFYYKFHVQFLKFIVTKGIAPGMLDPSGFDHGGFHLPLGISFFTLAAMAYLVDIYRKETGAERNVIDFALYMSHFSKIVAGPIVRYRDMSVELGTRRLSLENFSFGIRRFAVGLAKKVLVSAPVSQFASETFNGAHGLDMPTAWLGIVCYTIQIYFDFSGYSDMAIGIGRMFGFTFMENFKYPYISQSIREFWRRWHISLSTWLRDYLYIPLGGSRRSRHRTSFNVIVVFLLCGLWHGAEWHYIIWGGYHGFFLALERGLAGRYLEGLWRPLRHLYAILVVMIGWIFFRAENFNVAMRYLRAMFSFSTHSFDYYRMSFFNSQLLLALIVGVVGSAPLPALGELLRGWVEARNDRLLVRFFEPCYSIAIVGFTIFLLAVSVMQIAVSTFSPFIYGKF
jgi:alginate O-acetyltransferase complex protein AlgI